ncbi:MAG: polysaccharide biosynthesis protein [Janthinobacterium lividum]
MAPRSLNRILVNLLTDGALAAAAAPVARYLAAPGGGLLHPIWFVAGGAITLLLSGVPARLPQQYWRFSGLGDLLGVAIASVASAALFSLGLALTGTSLPSATFPVIHALTLMAFLSAPRLVYRLYHGRGRGEAQSPPVLLIGADEAADLFLRAAAQDRGPALRIAGLISLGRRQTGRRLRGHTILGGLDELGSVLERLRRRGRTPSALVLTEPEFSGAPLAALMATADAAGIPVRRAPRPTALLSAERTGEGSRIELRPVAIEDLLNRPQVPLDRDAIAALVRGRRVLVTGAGGTIGSELARQLAGLEPAELVLLDNGEYALWQIDTELAEIAPDVVRRVVIADVRDATRVRAAFSAHEPELVFHAAALKHVPMVEANPLEGLLTNAVGTRHVADAARAVGAAAMVLISTDKAVNPTSMMGASKRLAEMYCQALDIAARAGGGMRLVTVRFGNVLGSTGSVVPLFRRQLERGGPLTVTHPDMQRYFMTVREAVGLVLQASVLGAAGEAGGGGEEAHVAAAVSPSLAATVPAGTLAPDAEGGAGVGGIYVLDMGEPVRIVDLARQMIRLAGLREGEDVAIRYTGLRPGEKLYEELFHGREPPVPTGRPGLLMAAPRTVDPAAMARALDAIAGACQAGQVGQALLLLSRLVPEYVHDPLGAQPARTTPIRPAAIPLPSSVAQPGAAAAPSRSDP